MCGMMFGLGIIGLLVGGPIGLIVGVMAGGFMGLRKR